VYKRYLVVASAIMLGGFGCGGDSRSPTEPAPASPATAASTAVLKFQELSAGIHHTCGLTSDGKAYCWGFGADGSVNLSPVAVAGGRRFRQISAGYDFTCGVGTDYLVYCWGSTNISGQLGDGTTTPHSAPAPVTGDHHFQQVDAGAYHACAVSYHNGPVYCWGANSFGQLGDGTTTSRRRPVAVASSLLFKRIGTGWEHSCAVTTDNWAYCWGGNRYGQLGDSTSVLRRNRPVRVAGNRHFRLISTGFLHSCAVTPTGRAFCWGHGLDGELGNGKTYLSFWPRAVAGGLYFQQLTSGAWYNCAVTTDFRAYCWGHNGTSQLGDGTRNFGLRPVAVIGGLEFRQVTGGDEHTCGVTTTGAGYCWGANDQGELGNGTTGPSTSPVKVAGAL
jgi:alpha-tubulin suppressor-like RCC1 family protein